MVCMVASWVGFAACVAIPLAGPREPARDVVASALLWRGANVDKLYTPGQVRSFTFVQAGRTIGRSWGRYDGPAPERPELYRFVTRIELTPPGRAPLRSEGEIVVDRWGELASGFERSEAAELRFERMGDRLVVSSMQEREELACPSGTAYMAHGAIIHQELMLATRTLMRGELSMRLVSLSGGLPVDWKASVERVDERDPERISVRTSLGEHIEFYRGRLVRIDVADETMEVRADDPPAAWPDWTIARPRELVYRQPHGASFTRHDVELPGRAGEPKLFGEVLLPTSGSPPHAAVLFLSGTGQQDRFGFAGPPAVDLGSHEITDAFAQAGFVVIRYDERGFGHSEPGELGFEDQLEDARRALRTLLVQEQVDAGRIIIVGHGEGGWRALRLAAERRREIAAVALLASPGRRYDAIMREHAELGLRKLPPELREDARREHARMLAKLKDGGTPPPELARHGTWLSHMLRLDPDVLIGNVSCPLVFAQGGKDFEVDPRLDLDALHRFAEKHRKRHEILRYPELDHLFKRETGLSSPEQYVVADRAVDRTFLADLVRWAIHTVGRPGRVPERRSRR